MGLLAVRFYISDERTLFNLIPQPAQLASILASLHLHLLEVVPSCLAPKGTVQMETEVWYALPEKEDEIIQAGTKVKVVSLEGLTLKVTKFNE